MIVRARMTSPPSRWTWRVAGSIALDRARDQDLRAEAARLLQRAARQLVARHAGGEAEVVLDPRRGPSLTAGRLALDDDGAKALRGAVDRGGQAGGPGADDHRVVLRRLRARSRARGARPHGAAAAERPSCRRSRGWPAGPRRRGSGPSQMVGRVRLVRREPAERDLVAVEEVPQRPCTSASQRCPTTIARGGGGSAARPWRPRSAAHPVRGEAADLLGECGAVAATAW